MCLYMRPIKPVRDNQPPALDTEFPALISEDLNNPHNPLRKQSYASIASKTQARVQVSDRTNDTGPKPKRRAPPQVGYNKEERNACIILQRPASPIISYTRVPTQDERVIPQYLQNSPNNTLNISTFEHQPPSQASQIDVTQNDQSMIIDYLDDEMNGNNRKIITYNEEYLQYECTYPTCINMFHS